MVSGSKQARKKKRRDGLVLEVELFHNPTLKSLSVSFSDKNALKKEQNFIIHEQKSLAHHVIYKQSLSSLIHCALMCTNSPFCKSVNFISEQGGNFGECQLNDATAEDFPFHLMRVSNSVYSVVYSSWDRIMLLVQHCLQGRRRKGGGVGEGRREWEGTGELKRELMGEKERERLPLPFPIRAFLHLPSPFCASRPGYSTWT